MAYSRNFILHLKITKYIYIEYCVTIIFLQNIKLNSFIFQLLEERQAVFKKLQPTILKSKSKTPILKRN